MRNKPNSAGTVRATSTLLEGTYDELTIQSALEKQSQFPAVLRAPNKANLPPCPVGRGRRDGGRGPAVQTKPICRRRAGKTIAKASGLDAATHRETNVRNEANFSIADWGQSCGGTARPATCRLRPARANRAKRTQFPAGRGIPPFQYSIIPAFQSDACRAKQSQFPDEAE